MHIGNALYIRYVYALLWTATMAAKVRVTFILVISTPHSIILLYAEDSMNNIHILRYRGRSVLNNTRLEENGNIGNLKYESRVCYIKLW